MILHEITGKLMLDRVLMTKFLSLAGVSLKKFRYFEKRVPGVVAEHAYTFIGSNGPQGELPIVYGHLAKDAAGDPDVLWLGLCVIEGWTGKGFGKAMLRALLQRADHSANEVRLVVDSDNAPAIALYEKSGFRTVELITSSERTEIIMSRKARKI